MANDEWYTPLDLLLSVKHVQGCIGFDPTCSEKSLAAGLADFYVTKESDCLEFEWWRCADSFGPLFLNPPYSGPAPFTDQAIAYGEHQPGTVLVNASTSTQWGQRLLKAGAAVCFFSPRIRFLRPRGEGDDLPTAVTVGEVELVQPPSPRYDNMAVLLDPDDCLADRFIKEFNQFGYCTRLS